MPRDNIETTTEIYLRFLKTSPQQKNLLKELIISRLGYKKIEKDYIQLQGKMKELKEILENYQKIENARRPSILEQKCHSLSSENSNLRKIQLELKKKLAAAEARKNVLDAISEENLSLQRWLIHKNLRSYSNIFLYYHR